MYTGPQLKPPPTKVKQLVPAGRHVSTLELSGVSQFWSLTEIPIQIKLLMGKHDFMICFFQHICILPETFEVFPQMRD